VVAALRPFKIALKIPVPDPEAAVLLATVGETVVA
jgi:hypothetical protein